MSIVEFKNVYRAYKKGENVLKDVTFSVGGAEVVGLLGKNGAGKTTLIRIAMGMLETQKGSVRVFDMDPREKPIEVKRRVGYVSEDQILPPFLRVGDVVDLHRGLFPAWDDDMAMELTRKFKLSPRAKIGSLSKGQARQVALLCAVSHRPELLLLDEPAGGLDPAARREFLETSIQLLNDAGSTILFSSHHMTDVERMAGRVVMIHEGSLLVDSDMDKLLDRPGAVRQRQPHGETGCARRLCRRSRTVGCDACRVQTESGSDPGPAGKRPGGDRFCLPECSAGRDVYRNGGRAGLRVNKCLHY
jgi:ABC-2 type transport system ATP-binding protein